MYICSHIDRYVELERASEISERERKRKGGKKGGGERTGCDFYATWLTIPHCKGHIRIFMYMRIHIHTYICIYIHIYIYIYMYILLV